MPSSTLVEVHRRDLLGLVDLALADLAVLFRGLSTADEARSALMDVLPQLVLLYGEAAASMAADWYDEVREADEVPGGFRAIPAELPDQGRTDALARWGIGPLFAAAPDFVTAQAKVGGGLQRIVADAGRQTILRSVEADPSAGGWSRRTTSKSCDFCKLIEARGAVYSASTADFSSHDDCDCVAVPAFGQVRDVRRYVPSQKFAKGSDKNTPSELRAKNNERIRNALNEGKPVKPGSRRRPVDSPAPRDIDAGRTVTQLRTTLASLEKTLERFDSPGTRARVEDLRRKIAARS